MSNATNKEYILPDNTVILSTADLQGNIVTYNQGFKDASGYTDEELHKKPHSILRHPDMPKEAFKDFWDTIQAGRPWVGMVKNKRKNGDHYWVIANASPITENGQITGYVSVRYPASKQQVQEAEQLYAAVKAGTQPFPRTQIQDTRLRNQILGIVAVLATLIPFIVLFAGVEVSAGLEALMMVFGVAAVSFLAYSNYRTTDVPQHLRNAVEALSNGQYKQPIKDRGYWGFALNQIRTRVGEAAANNYDSEQASAIMLAAMDAASTSLMVVDRNFNITKINRSLHELFTQLEPKIRTELPHFSVNKVVGSNMDIFHKNPSHQRQMMAKVIEKTEVNITVAGIYLTAIVQPIKMGSVIVGYAVEWLDRTVEETVVAELSSVFEGMKQGNFNGRITSPAVGVYDRIKSNVNESMSVIQHALDSINGVIEAQATGDFTKALPSGTFKGQMHALKNAINFSAEKVRQAIAQAVVSSSIVQEQAGNVADGAHSLSSRVQEQASALQETSMTMQEMKSTVQANTERATQVANLSDQMKAQAGSGMDVMQQTITAMQSIQEANNRIVDIVAMIDSIAFQTNLLALNAAVEAARAGEHGRGFAVVASEVRALAQKSADAAQDIKALIGDSVQRITAGTRLADKSGEMLGEITSSIEKVADMMSEISRSSSEQSTAIGQVYQAIDDIDRVTQENAALVEETTAAVAQLSQEADALMENVRFFNVGQTQATQKPLAPSKALPKLALPSHAKTVKAQQSTAKASATEWQEF
ncbi:MAG: methyl-accepting chemotaxis protein [Gammaproteobacteria bacterium]|nr:methyl-accepting chemotaxis protein [Gammaproteobacteria bacterium]MCL5796170.1 methyl-accepting chemotaxis protein [Gammaproteobacteria bacterium]